MTLPTLQAMTHDGHQHQERAGHGIDEELDGRVEAVGAAPYPDDEIHRDQHHLEEDVKEKQIEGDKDADQAGQERKHQGVEPPLPPGDGGPACQHAERHHDRGEQHHEQRDAVDSYPVADAPAGNPGSAGNQLHPAVLGSNAHQSPSDNTSSSRVTTSAVRLAVRSSPSRMGTTPASGNRISACRIHWL